MGRRLHLWWIIRVYCKRSHSSVEVEQIISQIHKILTSPQRDHMTFVEMERELALRYFFRDIDIYNYTFLQEYHVAREFLVTIPVFRIIEIFLRYERILFNS